MSDAPEHTPRTNAEIAAEAIAKLWGDRAYREPNRSDKLVAQAVVVALAEQGRLRTDTERAPDEMLAKLLGAEFNEVEIHAYRRASSGSIGIALVTYSDESDGHLHSADFEADSLAAALAAALEELGEPE